MALNKGELSLPLTPIIRLRSRERGQTDYSPLSLLSQYWISDQPEVTPVTLQVVVSEDSQFSKLWREKDLD